MQFSSVVEESSLYLTETPKTRVLHHCLGQPAPEKVLSDGSVAIVWQDLNLLGLMESFGARGWPVCSVTQSQLECKQKLFLETVKTFGFAMEFSVIENSVTLNGEECWMNIQYVEDEEEGRRRRRRMRRNGRSRKHVLNSVLFPLPRKV